MPPKKKQKTGAKVDASSAKKPAYKFCPYTDEKVWITTVTLQDMKKAAKTGQCPTVKGRKVLVRIPSKMERDKILDKSAAAIEQIELQSLPLFGGRSWSVDVKLVEPSNKKPPLFRWFRGQLELATLPHLLEKLPEAPRVRDAQIYLADEDTYTPLQARERSMLSNFAFEDSEYGVPIVNIKWISPNHESFYTRKAAMAALQTMCEQEALLKKCLQGIGGRNDVLLQPTFLSKPKVLQVGKLRFLRDGLWVVGQEDAWQQERAVVMQEEEERRSAAREKFGSNCMDVEGSIEPEAVAAPKKQLSGLAFYLQSKKEAYRAEKVIENVEARMTLREAERELREVWRTLDASEQEEWKDRAKQSVESRNVAPEQDESQCQAVPTDGAAVGGTQLVAAPKRELLGLAYNLQSKREAYGAETFKESGEAKMNFREAERESREVWKIVDSSEQESWKELTKQDVDSQNAAPEEGKSAPKQDESKSQGAPIGSVVVGGADVTAEGSTLDGDEKERLSMTGLAFFLQSLRQTFRVVWAEKHKSQHDTEDIMTLLEAETELRGVWNTLDPDTQNQWKERAKQHEETRRKELSGPMAISKEGISEKEFASSNAPLQDPTFTPKPVANWVVAANNAACGVSEAARATKYIEPAALSLGNADTEPTHSVEERQIQGTAFRHDDEAKTMAAASQPAAKQTAAVTPGGHVNAVPEQIVTKSRSRESGVSASQPGASNFRSVAHCTALASDGDAKVPAVAAAVSPSPPTIEDDIKPEEESSYSSSTTANNLAMNANMATSSAPELGRESQLGTAEGKKPQIDTRTPPSKPIPAKKRCKIPSSFYPDRRPSAQWKLSPEHIKLCYDAAMNHFEIVMNTVKARALHSELQDGFDVLRERGRGRYDMELPDFDTDEFNFLTDIQKASWMPIVCEVLGPDVSLIHKGAFLSMPGAEAQVYHQDGPHLTTKTQRPCHAVNVFIPLVDLHIRNGPTEFVLGSHYLGHDEHDRERVFTPVVPAGTPVMFDYRLGHRGLSNSSSSCRPIVYCTYASSANGKEFRDGVNFSRRRYHKIGDLVAKPLTREERLAERMVKRQKVAYEEIVAARTASSSSQPKLLERNAPNQLQTPRDQVATEGVLSKHSSRSPEETGPEPLHKSGDKATAPPPLDASSSNLLQDTTMKNTTSAQLVNTIDRVPEANVSFFGLANSTAAYASLSCREPAKKSNNPVFHTHPCPARQGHADCGRSHPCPDGSNGVSANDDATATDVFNAATTPAN